MRLIEKIISLGSPAKRLALVRGKGALAPGAKLFLDAEKKSEAGLVTSAALADGEGVALALLRKNALEEGRTLFAESEPVRIVKIAAYE